jgi:hypothetical protein
VSLVEGDSTLCEVESGLGGFSSRPSWRDPGAFRTPLRGTSTRDPCATKL